VDFRSSKQTSRCDITLLKLFPIIVIRFPEVADISLIDEISGGRQPWDSKDNVLL